MPLPDGDDDGTGEDDGDGPGDVDGKGEGEGDGPGGLAARMPTDMHTITRMTKDRRNNTFISLLLLSSPNFFRWIIQRPHFIKYFPENRVE
jgi:hypothetical protein